MNAAWVMDSRHTGHVTCTPEAFTQNSCYRHSGLDEVLFTHNSNDGGKFPDKAPQLFAYLRWIVHMHAARNFQGSAWVAYDHLYQHQVLVWHSLHCQEDSALYNEAFVHHTKAYHQVPLSEGRISPCAECSLGHHATLSYHQHMVHKELNLTGN